MKGFYSVLGNYVRSYNSPSFNHPVYVGELARGVESVDPAYREGLKDYERYLELDERTRDYVRALEDEVKGYEINVKKGDGNVLGTYRVGEGDIDVYLAGEDKELDVFLAYETLFHEMLHALQDKYASDLVYSNPLAGSLWAILGEAQANMRFGGVVSYDDLVKKLVESYGIEENMAKAAVDVVSSLYVEGMERGYELGSLELDKYVAGEIGKCAADWGYVSEISKRYGKKYKDEVLGYLLLDQKERFERFYVSAFGDVYGEERDFRYLC